MHKKRKNIIITLSNTEQTISILFEINNSNNKNMLVKFRFKF